MALVLDGTNGVSGVDGTASNPAIEGTDGNTGIFYPAADTVAIGTGGTEALRVNSSQQVGIGTSSPAQTLHVKTSTASGPITLGVLSNSTTLPALSFNGAYASSTMAGIYSNGVAASNLYYTVPASQSHFFAIADSTKMTLDASGNLVVGATSTSSRFEAVSGTGAQFVGTFRTGDSTAANNAGGGFYAISSGTAASREAVLWLDADGANLAGADYFWIRKYGNSGNVEIIQQSNAAMTFQTNGTERARIDSSGNFLVGTTTSQGLVTLLAAGGSSSSVALSIRPVSDTLTAVNFRNAAGSQVGNISITSTATAYNTSSDYRLKENIAPMTGALSVVQQLKPVTYKWKADGSDGQGFIAHELAEVCPQAVSGEKDAVDEDGNIKPQGIDTSFLVATLTAAIQEQQAMIDELKAKVAALKGAA